MDTNKKNNMDINKKNVSVIINFYNHTKRIFKFLHIYLPLSIFVFMFSLNINIYVCFIVLILTAYITRVLWVFSVNKYNVYKLVGELLEKEITKNFK